LAGGPPCQGFSTAGPCRPNDSRNRLVFAFLAAVERLRPEIVLVENVASLMWRGRLILSEMLRVLRNAGYDASVALMHAEGYGVPQLRRRLFVLASRGRTVAWPRPWRRIVSPAHLEHQPGISDDDLPPAFTVGQAIGDLPLDEAESFSDSVSYAAEATSPLQRWARGELSNAQLVVVRAAPRRADLFLAPNSMGYHRIASMF